MNLLKLWHPRKGRLITPYPPKPAMGSQVPNAAEEPHLGDTLSAEQQRQLWRLLKAFNTTVSSLPGQTTIMQHTIQTNPREVVWETTCPLS